MIKANIDKLATAMDNLLEAQSLINKAKYSLMNTDFVFSRDSKDDIENALQSVDTPIRELSREIGYLERQKENKKKVKD